MNNIGLIKKLENDGVLSHREFSDLISSYTEKDLEYARSLAREISQKIFGNKIYIRGLIEFTNICSQDCFYCGLRCSNKNADRYRLTKNEILDCCKEGYALGFRTFVLQGGEDPAFDERTVCDIIRSIKDLYPDCALTLSIGEKPRKTYKAYKNVGADRFLLRHETANSEHFQKLHPITQTLSSRKECLFSLKELGFQTGCGFMVGSPYQTPETLADDMLFLYELKPHMVGIGPFIPHKDTPFKNKAPGSLSLTLFLLALTRIMLKSVLLPATTALGTISADGREQGILSGANVVMPNLSPGNVREKYMLYNNKVSSGSEAAEGLSDLKIRMERIGYEVTVSRGDYPNI